MAHLLAGADARRSFDQGGLLDALKKALSERALNAEMDHHLAGEDGAGNSRNGYGRKTVMTDTGKIELEVPRDRQATFDPQLIAKYQRRFPGFADKIVSMYARGMSTREIVGHLRDLYGIDVSPDLISAVTDAVLDEVATWQARPLEAIYPLVFFDALRVKIRDEGLVRNKAVHIALGVRADGGKEVLGLGPALSGDRPELAPGLDRGRAILRLPRRRPENPLYYQRHRGAECQAAPHRPRQGPLPHRPSCSTWS